MRPSHYSVLLILLVFSLKSFGQVGIGTTTPNPNAVLHLKSPGNNQGFLVPRLTTAQRSSITGFTSADNGLLVYDSNLDKFFYWQTEGWVQVDAPQDLNLNGNVLSITNNPNATPVNLSAFTGTNTDDQTLSYNPSTGQLTISRLSGNQSQIITAAGSAGGDLTGTYPNPTVGAGAITTAKLADNSVNAAKIVDGSVGTAELANGSVTSGKMDPSGATAGTYGSATQVSQVTVNAQGRVTSVSNVAISGVTPSGSAGGDLTGTYPNPTVGAGAITTAKLADNSVNAAKIIDGSVGTAELANGSVTSGKMDPSGATAGTYGSATQVSQVTVNAQGRVTSVSNVAISGITPSGSAGGDLTGTYPNPTIGNGSVNSAKIADGSIVDADINTSAGIQVSKLANGTNGQFLSTTGGVPIWATLPDASATNEIQSLSFANPNLSISGGNSVNLSGLNTDSQTLSFSSPNISISGGNAINISSINTDAQTLTVTSSTTNRTIAISGGNNQTFSIADNDNDATNEIQDLSLSGNTLSLSGDVTPVNLSTYLDNTDAQTLTFTSPNLSISGGNAVNLSGINTDAQNLTFTSPNLSISGGNSVNLSSINTDAQTLTVTSSTTNRTIAISGGNNQTFSVADNDNSTTNELQTLSVSGNQLTISSGNTVTLPSSSGVTGSGSGGQVAYWSGASSITGNSNLFWDEKTSSLGIGVTPQANLHFGGSHAVVVNIASGDYVVTEKDYVIIAPNAATSVLLPDAETLLGRILIIRSTDSKGVTVRSSSGKDLIDGVESITVADSDNGSVYSVTIIAATAGRWITLTKAVK